MKNKKKEITVFSCGDSSDIQTWSNVPYLFTNGLKEKGYKINRIDISPSEKINRIFNTLSYIIFKKIFKLEACPEFHRTALHRWISYRRIKKATKKYTEVQFNLFLTYAFINPYSDKPSVNWCDWSDEVVIQRIGRDVKWYESRSIEHERKVMSKSDLVISMFPDCAEIMKKLYNRDVLWLKGNVVNTTFSPCFLIEDIIKKRSESNDILFIGGVKYHNAATELIDAYKEIRKKYPNAKLHIIGMKDSDFEIIPDGVNCYGYLRKTNKIEGELYYKLLLNSRVLVNHSSQWGGYSSSIEAMYYGCPIIVAPYKDFVLEFGEDINFGYYVKDDDLLDRLNDIFLTDNYDKICLNAYNRVKDYTWSNYIDKFLEVVNKHI